MRNKEYICQEHDANFIMCKNKATIFLHYQLSNIYVCICDDCYHPNMDFLETSIRITKEEYSRILQTKILK